MSARQFEIEVGTRTRAVTVQRAGSAWVVTLDGVPHHVDAATVDGQTLSLLIGDGEDGAFTRSCEVAVVPQGASTTGVDVHLTGRVVPAQVRVSGGFGRRRDGTAAGTGPQRITAPMPGRVVRVLVAPGDTVEVRQGLVVVEAMKMENELRATRAGRVASVAVAEGQSVDSGALLVVVE